MCDVLHIFRPVAMVKESVWVTAHNNRKIVEKSEKNAAILEKTQKNHH